jgi:hypothetical protein
VDEEKPRQTMSKTVPGGVCTYEDLIRIGMELDHRPGDEHEETLLIELARAWLRVRTRAGVLEPLTANAVQRTFEMRRGQANIVLKARQMGLTTWAAARFFLKTITRPGTLTLQVAHTQQAAEEIFRIVHRFLNELPDEVRRQLRTSRANVRQLTFPLMDSQYLVISAGERGAGRGLTVQNLHCSELARWPGDAAETLAGLRAALTPDGEQILESTPNGVGGCFYDEWQAAGSNGVVNHFFPWWLESHYRTEAVDEASLTAEERALMKRAKLSLEQVGFRRRLHAGFHSLVSQEYAEDSESSFLASGDAVFELSAIEKRMIDVLDPVAVRYNGALSIWLPPVSERLYLVAVDPAGGGADGDYSAAQVVEMKSGLQCAEFAAHVGGLELARLVTDLAAEYNHAWLVIERNNHGTGVLALADTVCGYTRLYHQNGEMGWLTTRQSRPVAVSRFGAALVEVPQCFQSRKLLIECRGFVHLPNGGSGARAGMHDDRIMAMAIALAVREELLTRGAGA